MIVDALSVDWTYNVFFWLWFEDVEFGNLVVIIVVAKLPVIQAVVLA